MFKFAQLGPHHGSHHTEIEKRVIRIQLEGILVAVCFFFREIIFRIS